MSNFGDSSPYCFSPELTHVIRLVKGLMISWQVESDVLALTGTNDQIHGSAGGQEERLDECCSKWQTTPPIARLIYHSESVITTYGLYRCWARWRRCDYGPERTGWASSVGPQCCSPTGSAGGYGLLEETHITNVIAYIQNPMVAQGANQLHFQSWFAS